MSKLYQLSNLLQSRLTLATAICLFGAAIGAQTPAGQPAALDPPAGPAQSPSSNAKPSPEDQPEKRITPEEAKELFGLVDQLLKFSSEETGLAIKSQVKRQLTTRGAVEHYLEEKFNEDEDAKRMQRSEIVLKKFGFLDRDFDLKPFLLALLKEQIEAYYDPKEKTVNLLDWVSVDEQKPVLAHELTHALQDQHLDLDKWSDQTPPDVSHTSPEDSDHLAKDEIDTARDAVTEGQATAVMMDNVLKPMGKSLIHDPEVVDFMKRQMAGSENSPVLARAPLLLSESLLFPYREGLSFEQDVWMDRGQTAAFVGALDRPPASTWEVMNPREYEQGHAPSIPYMPDIHPLVDGGYRAYDIGQVGELDVQILASLFGGDRAARDLTPAWDGGIYWAGQRLTATPAEQASTKSIAFFYLSVWKNSKSAESFAQLYADELGRKYSGLQADKDAENTSAARNETAEHIWRTNEGPVLVVTRGKMVFITESFELPLAHKLADLILGSQGSGPVRVTFAPPAGGSRLVGNRTGSGDSLTAPMVRFLSGCGVMKVVADAAVRSTR